jgi:hypothetical protein
VYESKQQPPISTARFLLRLLRHFLASQSLVLISLAVGMWGYEHFEKLGWREAFENAAMLLGGMGPVNIPVTDDGKVFAGLFALYAGLLFLVLAGVLFAPVLHRVLHRLHWEKDENLVS